MSLKWIGRAPQEVELDFELERQEEEFILWLKETLKKKDLLNLQKKKKEI